MSVGDKRPTRRGKPLKNKHEQQNQGTTGQVQNIKSSRIYVFGDNNIEEEEILYEASELREVRARGRARQEQIEAARNEQDEEIFIEREIAENDTLQSIALKYSCRVSEIKRINNLLRDQDFYGLTTIKVPIKRHGLLTELLEEENNRPLKKHLRTADALDVLEANDEDDEEEEIDDSDQRQLLVRKVSIRDAISNQGKEAASFLQKMDTDIHSIIKSTKLRMDSLEEVTKSLTCKRIQPLQRQTSWLNGADCGIRWWSAVILFVVVGLLMPTFYILYVKYGKPEP